MNSLFYNGSSVSRSTCFGNPEQSVLDNNAKFKKCKFWDEFLEDVEKNFKTIALYSGFNFHICDHGFMFGIEAPYKWDDTQIIYIDFNDISESYIEEGRAFGYYGSQCLTRKRYYKNYVRNSKFIRFCNKWQVRLKKRIKEYLRSRKDHGKVQD